MFKNYTLKDFERDMFKRNGKYTVLGVAMSVIHLCYAYLYLKLNFMPMVLYNIVSIAGYLYLSYECIRTSKTKALYYYILIEVPLHAILSTYLLGWNYRFMLVTIGIIPCLFYFVLFIDDFNSKVITPAIFGITYSTLYVCVRLLCTNHKAPLYYAVRNEASLYEPILIYFNTLVCFAAIIFFNSLTSIEYKYIKSKFAGENDLLGTYASLDALTQLFNRRSTNAALEKLYKDNYNDSESFSVIMCDIDKFKLVNDTHGHDAGDVVLREVAAIIKRQVRDHDVVGRWGGEEFLIIVNSNYANTVALAERIRKAVEASTFTYKNIELKITLTLGVSSYRSGIDLSQLITAADMKLYRGKENGRNQVVS